MPGRLMLTRKVGEKIVMTTKEAIPKDTKIVIEYCGGRSGVNASLGFIAPTSISIMREELLRGIPQSSQY